MYTETSLNIATGSEVKLSNRPDGGVDIWLRLYVEGWEQWIRVDAKGVWKMPIWMLIPTQDLVFPDERRVGPGGELQLGAVRPRTIYVQGYRPPGQDENENGIFPWPLNGWMWGYEVMQYAADWFKGNSRYVHMVPSWGEESMLHPMDELLAMYCDRWRHPFAEESQLADYCDDVILRGGHGGQHERMAAVPQSGSDRDASLRGR